MAEIWYLSLDDNVNEGDSARHEYHIIKCIELLELTPERWECGPEEKPELKTGNPLIDESGYIYVYMKAGEDEIEAEANKNWKPGWYKSSVSIVGLEKKLRKSSK